MYFFVSGIYQIRNEVNGKVYIGSSLLVASRLKGHKGQLKRNKHHNIKLQNAWNKYGAENFTFTLLEECAEERLIELEQEYMDKFDSIRNGYNIREAGSIGRHSPETKEKLRIVNLNRPKEINERISKSKMGHSVSPEARRKIGDAQIGNRNREGKTFTEESKKKMSDALRGRKISEEVRQKIVNSLIGNTRAKGRKLSEEHKRKISESLNKIDKAEVNKRRSESLRGRKQSEETKRKIAEAMKGKKNAKKRPDKEAN